MTNKNEVVSAVYPKNDVVLFDYGTDHGVGFEDISTKDLSIPFLSILQAQSQQVLDNNPEGARMGQLFNTVTKELIDGSKGVGICPVYYEEVYAEWVPRDKGRGGFAGIHLPNSDVVKQAMAKGGGAYSKDLHTPSGNQLVLSQYVYVLLLNETFDTPTGFCLIAFTGTKIKTRRDWFTSIYLLGNAQKRPPLFANRALLKTTLQQNSKGKFYNFQIEPINGNWLTSLADPVQNKELLAEGKRFREIVSSGMARINHEHAGIGEEEADLPF